MTIKELIDKLDKYSPDAEIYVSITEPKDSIICSIESEMIKPFDEIDDPEGIDSVEIWLDAVKC